MSCSIASPAYATLAKDTPTVMTMPGLIAGTQELASGRDEAVGRLGKLSYGCRPTAWLFPAAFLDGWRALSDSICKMMCVAGSQYRRFPP